MSRRKRFFARHPFDVDTCLFRTAVGMFVVFLIVLTAFLVRWWSVLEAMTS